MRSLDMVMPEEFRR